MDRRRLLLVLVAAQVLLVSNANMIAVALPPLARELEASPTAQQWIVDAYVLVFAALLVAGGVAGDRYGRRRALVGGLVLFAAGSLACALSPGPGLLIAARVVQGLAPPLVLPASLAILAAAYAEPAQRSRAIGVWGAASGSGIAIGPLLGGLIVDGMGWRGVFALSAPTAALLAVAARRSAPVDDATSDVRFDVLGAALITAAMASLVYATIEGPGRGWLSVPVLGAYTAGVALVAVFGAAERRHPAPLVDLALLRVPRFAAANGGGGTVMFALLGTTVYLSAYFQGEHGFSPLETGLALLPLGGAVALFAPLAGRSTSRVAPRTLMIAGMVAAGAGALWLSRISAGDGPGATLPALLLMGAGVGCSLPAMTFTAVAAVPKAKAGMASAVHNASRQFGATLGVAVLGSIVVSHATVAEGLRPALVVTGALLLAGALAILLLVDRKPRATT